MPIGPGPHASAGYLDVGGAALYWRERGQGTPLVTLHGGPDFDHAYLLPELDRLGDACRVVFYDQRGRGRSATGVRPDDVTMASEIADLDRLRDHLGVATMAVLGHSWGGVLAMAYAARHPDRVSHLVLMGSAPASHAGWIALREHLERVRDVARLRELRSTAAYAAGDPDTVAAYYRVHFRPALRLPEHIGIVVDRLRRSFTREGILLARAIEDRLYVETSQSPGFDLLPALARLDIPALVLHGDHDFVPLELAEHIAGALPLGRLVVLPECGHFASLERPEETIAGIVAFLRETAGQA